MRLSRVGFLAVLAVGTALIVSCTDRPAPTEAVRTVGRRTDLTSCASLAQITNMVMDVFGTSATKMPNTNSALAKLDLIDKKLSKHTHADTLDAQAHTRDLIEFIRAKAYELADRSKVQALIDALECYAGIKDNTVFLMPQDAITTFVSSSGSSGIQFPADAVDTPTLVTITELPVSDSGLLHTKLDKYPGFISITQSGAADGNALRPTVQVTVEVCPVGVTDPDVLGRLRLGHQGSSGFEITPKPTTGPILDCANRVARATGKASGWLRSLASLVLPKPLYARIPFGGGGVGGTAGEFSPFGPVDPYLSFSGGVGGTAGEFIREGPQSASQVATSDPAVQVNTRPMSSTESAILFKSITACDQVEVGAEVPESCRPLVTLQTKQGTPMVGVTVTYKVGTNGGGVAVDNPFGVTPDCAPDFKENATTVTNANGHVRACWKAGATKGEYTLTAKPLPTGDASLPGIVFSQAETTFTLTAAAKPQTTPLVVSLLPTGSTSIVYGSSGQLTATGGDGGGLVTFATTSLATVCEVTPGGLVTARAGTGNCVVTATRAGTDVYQALTSAALSIPLAKAAPVITWANPADITYGTTLSIAQLNAMSSSDGLLTYLPAAGTALNAGGGQTLTVTQSETGNYTAQTKSVTINVQKAAPEITWSNPADITYGTELSIAQLNATSSSNGTLTFTPAAGTVLNAGANQTLSVTTAETPNYTALTKTVAINVEKAAVTATAGSGNFTYTGQDQAPSACVVTGTNPDGLTCANSPAVVRDATTGTMITPVVSGAMQGNYTITPKTGTVVIAKATPVITWGNPADITYGTALDGTQLRATSTSGGALTYTPAAGTVLNAGASQTLSVTTAEMANYTELTKTVTINVAKAAATATAGGGSMLLGGPVPALACSVEGLVSSGDVTCTTKVPATLVAGANQTSPIPNPANPANYLLSLIPGTLRVQYVQVGCFSSPIYSAMPESKSAQRKGSNLPVKCGLTNALGVAVTNATGTLIVEDRGLDGNALGTLAFDSKLTSGFMFKLSSGGNYSYGLDTSLPGFTAGHYYYVTATWNDGSKTTGWFLLK